jgi:hypothetical protein
VWVANCVLRRGQDPGGRKVASEATERGEGDRDLLLTRCAWVLSKRVVTTIGSGVVDVTDVAAEAEEHWGRGWEWRRAEARMEGGDGANGSGLRTTRLRSSAANFVSETGGGELVASEIPTRAYRLTRRGLPGERTESECTGGGRSVRSIEKGERGADAKTR